MSPAHLSVSPGYVGKGELHFGALKLPLVDPNDSPPDQGEIVHNVIQEGPAEGLFYSVVFVEKAYKGFSTGYEKTIHLKTTFVPSLMELSTCA